jgi:uncharacterized BrkB/YihY/UPF0761 family membrane protein
MPEHVVIAHIAVMVVPIAAVLAVLYAVAPSTRRALRWPLLAASALAAVLLIVAGTAGHLLLDEVKGTASPAEYEAAFRHAKSSDAVTSVAVLAAVAAPLAGWRFLRPDGARGRLAVVSAVVLALLGVALVVTAAATVVDALQAAWGTAR